MTAALNLGILGATGWLGQGLGLELLRERLWPASQLFLLNRTGPSPAYDGFPGITWAQGIGDLQARCDVIVLSVRPEDFPPPDFAPGTHLLISFMAGVPMERLRALAPKARLVRAMPNGGATTGTSFTPWIAGGTTHEDVPVIRRILSAMGEESRVASEDHLDILTALSGSGPAYPALMAEALLRHARRLGPPPDLAAKAVEAVICSAAAGLRERISGTANGVSEVIETMKSYRGVTAAGLEAAESAGFSDALGAALDSAVAKARAMGR